MKKINYITNYNCGIYKITNIINGKCYIGQSVRLKERFRTHRKHNEDSLFHRAIRKYKLENFLFEILIYCEPCELNLYELLFIQTFNTQSPNGYNLDMNGSEYPRAESTRKKISERMSTNHPMSRKVIDICGRTWENVKECAEFFNINNKHLSSMMNGKRLWYKFLKPLDLHYFSEHKDNYTFLTVEELEELIPKRHKRIPRIEKEITNKELSGGGNPMAKKVIDINGRVWNSLVECSQELNVNKTNLGKMINGNVPMLSRIKNLELKWFSDNKYKYQEEKQIKQTRKMKIRNKNQDYSNAKNVSDNIGRIWDSIKDCADFFQISANELQRYFRGCINEPTKIRGFGLYIIKDEYNGESNNDQ